MNQQNGRPATQWTYSAVVLGAALGMFGGLVAFLAMAGVCARALAAEFKWSSSEASLTFSAAMLGLTLGGPLVGMLMDRFGIRRIILILGVAYGLAVIAMSQQNGSVALWVGLSWLVGFLGTAVSLVGYLTVFPQWFDRHLGLALAVAMCGLGISTALMPPIAQYMVAGHGWRTTYVVLGAASIVLMLLAVLLLKENEAVPSGGRPKNGVSAEGAAVAEAVRTYRLWAIWGIFLVGAVCSLALFPHLPAMLVRRGFSPADAARGAAMLGVGLLAGRFVTGVLLDRVHAAFVACALFLAGAIGIVLLRTSHDFSSILLATALVGVTTGAEGDLISYMVRSYFGRRCFGTLYGISYSGYGIGSVIGPVAIGACVDRYGSYDQVLFVLPFMLACAGLLALTLGPYPAQIAAKPASMKTASDS
jgi:MFS transporter, OFA family, oxalate/formate antiporter